MNVMTMEFDVKCAANKILGTCKLVSKSRRQLCYNIVELSLLVTSIFIEILVTKVTEF